MLLKTYWGKLQFEKIALAPTSRDKTMNQGFRDTLVNGTIRIKLSTSFV